MEQKFGVILQKIFLHKFCFDNFLRLFSETEMALENPGKEKRKNISTEDIFDWLSQNNNSITNFISIN